MLSALARSRASAIPPILGFGFPAIIRSPISSPFHSSYSSLSACSALIAPCSCLLAKGRTGLSASSCSSTFAAPPFIGTRSVSDMAGDSSKTQQSLHDFAVKDVRGNDVELSQYKGKVLIVVNVASECGLTNSNYTELNQLYQKYKDKGLEILAFPCNQFGGQEPGTNEQIEQMVCTRFKAEFPVFDKVDVNGNNAAPVYKFLKSSKGSIFGDNIKWNFAKFLVDQEGHVVDRYAPTTSPLSIEKDIKKLLGIH